MEDKKYLPIEQDIIKTESGEILTVVDPEDILIVRFTDWSVSIDAPIFAGQLKDYHTPLFLFKERPDGLYEKFKINQEKYVYVEN